MIRASGSRFSSRKDERGFSISEVMIVMIIIGIFFTIVVATPLFTRETSAISRKQTWADAQAILTAARTYCRQGVGVAGSVGTLQTAGYLPAAWTPQAGVSYDLAGSDATRVVLRVTLPAGSSATPGDLKWAPAASWSVGGGGESILTVAESCVNPETGELAYGEVYLQ